MCLLSPPTLRLLLRDTRYLLENYVNFGENNTSEGKRVGAWEGDKVSLKWSRTVSRASDKLLTEIEIKSRFLMFVSIVQTYVGATDNDFLNGEWRKNSKIETEASNFRHIP